MNDFTYCSAHLLSILIDEHDRVLVRGGRQLVVFRVFITAVLPSIGISFIRKRLKKR
jgi:ribosomal protein S12